MRRIIILFPLVVLCLGWRIAAAGEDPEISVRSPSQAWFSRLSSPVFVDIRTNRGGTYRLTLETTAYRYSDKLSVTRTLALPANSASRLELTLPAPAYARLTCEGPAGSVVREVSGGGYSIDDDDPMPIACVNSFLLREIELGKDVSSRECASLPLDELPGRWQSYVGFTGCLLLAARDADSLRPEQRLAVLHWVRWLGGVVCVVGKEAPTVAASLGFAIDPARRDSIGEIERHRQLNGSLLLAGDVDVDSLFKGLEQWGDQAASPVHSYYSRRNEYYRRETPGLWLLDAFSGVSTNVIVAVLLALGVLMGPVNYLYIRRKKNSLLFFLTTPLIAVLGTVGIFAASMLSEGMGGSGNQFALLAADEEGDDAMLFDARGVRPGFFVPTPRFSESALVLPFVRSGEELSLSMDVTDGTRLTGGWMKPRFPSGFLVAQPVVGRLQVEVVREGEDYYVVNDLGYTLDQVTIKLPGESCAWAENVQPGARVLMKVENRDWQMRNLYREAIRIFGDSNALSGVSLVAKCRGLPYLEDGGVDASPIEREFYYCRIGNRETGVGR